MSDKLEKLFQATRAAHPDTARVEFGFETRLLARLRREPAPWFIFAWKLLPFFAVVVLVLGAWNYVSAPLDLPAILDSHANGDLLVNALAGGLR